MIRTRYHGPTMTQGARVVASTHDRQRITLHRDYSVTPEQTHYEAALRLANKLNLRLAPLRGQHWGPDDVYWITQP